MAIPRCEGELSVTYTVAMECPVHVDENGNLIPDGIAEEVDIVDGYDIWCDKHSLLSHDDYESHGIRDYWELI